MRRICLALLLLLFFVLPASALDFVTETVDEGSEQGEGTSIALDSDGNPHMSFIAEGDSSLQYTYYDGSEWNVTPVFTEGNVDYKQTDIALGEDNTPHIVAQKGYPNYSLIYATQNGTDWDVESFDLYGRFPSLALDHQGYPHIVSVNRNDYPNTVEYTWFDGTDWKFQTIISGDNGENYGNSTSIVLDQDGLPHVSFYAGCTDEWWGDEGHDLMYAYFDGETWSVESADWEGNVGKHSSIALDGNGIPHISYFDSNNGDLKYAFLSGDKWERFTVDSDDSVGQHTSIQVDSDGYVHISYYDCSNDDLKYASYDGIEWSFITVDSQDYVGRYTSLALDASGNPAISYYDSTNHDLKYASFDGETWSVQAIPVSGPPTGYAPEITLDSNEGPHMIYSAQTNNALVYAYKEGSEWQKQVIVSQDVDLRIKELTSEGISRSDYNACLTMDDNDTPHVLYGDSVYYEEEIGWQYELNYGVPSDGSWDFEALPFNMPDGDTVFYSLAVEGNGTPHISFVGLPDIDPRELGSSVSNYILRYAVKSGDMWDIASVDQEGYFGKNAIALDNNNTPHICYFKEPFYDGTLSANQSDGYELKYAALSADEWVTQTVSADLYGYELYCDLAVDSNGTPHIAFVKPVEGLEQSMETSLSRYENYELLYSTLTDGEWNTVLVDTLGYFGSGKLSIQLDSYNNPHITYGLNETADLIPNEVATTTGESELRYAYYDGSSWYTETLATGTMSGFGLQSSLALASNNIPHIAYFTGTGVNYMTVPEETVASSGDGCNLAIFSPAMVMLVLPLLGLFRKKN